MHSTLHLLATLALLALHLVAFADALPIPINLGQPLIDGPRSPFPHAKPTYRFQPRSEARRTVVGGHGVVILPGSGPIEVDGQETTKITVGGSTYQVVAGVDTVIDGVPVEDYIPVEGGEGGVVDGPSEQVSPGKAAAVAFAEAAERILGAAGER
ncbi:hypothetical protein C8A00DRAFT_38443 [Chaetomidium leptoderma]|uniref:Uncharacterized protein n=1 Tax=Chaetomidium leptoderma TaxID=669021 RepID=A0AAN6VCS4_9PEZI|nr:hypothetical protein C8A00DRAFT_38443 [Chaetomidium leptoderma]